MRLLHAVHGCPCHLQTLEGKDAKSPPTQEIRDMLVEVSKKIMSNPLWKETFGDQLPIYSLDNAAVHSKAWEGWIGLKDSEEISWAQADAGGMKHPQGTVCPVPPNSPDLHQVVEHTIANTTRLFKAGLLSAVMAGDVELSAFATRQDFVNLLQKAFEKAAKPESIAANVRTLHEKVYKRVIELEGKWPEAGLR